MNVLLISPFAARPLYGGAVVRIHHLARHLSRRHRLWWARRAGPHDPDIDATTIESGPSRWAQLFDPGLVLRLARLIKRERIECVVASSILTGLHGPLLKALTGARLVFDDHNVEHEQMRRAGQPAWLLMYLLERLVCGAADDVTCVSDADRGKLLATLRLEPGRVHVVPNGAAIPPSDDVQKTPTLLFFGVLGYRPNAAAVDVLLDEIVPRLRQEGWRLLIAGVGADQYLQHRRAPVPARVRFVGYLPDIVPLIRSAAAVLVPLTSGSGTRIKILEAIACGTPVVTTTIGAEGLDRHVLGPALRIHDDWDAFAREAETLIQAPTIHPPNEAFRARYDWTSVFAASFPL